MPSCLSTVPVLPSALPSSMGAMGSGKRDWAGAEMGEPGNVEDIDMLNLVSLPEGAE